MNHVEGKKFVQNLIKTRLPSRSQIKTEDTRTILERRQSCFSERLIEKMLLLCGVFSVIIIGLIFIFLFKEAVLFFKTGHVFDLIGKSIYDAWEEKNFFKMIWQPVSEVPKYSLVPLICGSFLVAFPATLIAAVFGIGTAIYLSEIASPKTREIFKPTLELLAGIPSVVLGFFMLAVVASLIQNIFHTKFRLNAFVGSVGVALATIPIITTLAEDALRSVPKELRNASYALGGTHWQTILHTVIPAAVSGISAGVILGFGRALGETMIVMMCTGNAGLVTLNFFSSVRTMTATIAGELGAVDQGSEHYYSLFLVGAVLFTFTFVLNLISESILVKMRAKLRM